MPSNDVVPPTLLDELDARQDRVIAQLDDLNQRVELILKQCSATATPSGDISAEPSGPLKPSVP